MIHDLVGLIIFLFFLTNQRKLQDFLAYYCYEYPKNIIKKYQSLYNHFGINIGWIYVKSRIKQIFCNKRVNSFTKDTLKIPYEYNDKTYYYILHKKRGIRPISIIKDQDGNCITDIITPYLGPNLDCHHIHLHPKDFGYAKISIELVDNTYKEFSENEIIKIY